MVIVIAAAAAAAATAFAMATATTPNRKGPKSTGTLQTWMYLPEDALALLYLLIPVYYYTILYRTRAYVPLE